MSTIQQAVDAWQQMSPENDVQTAAALFGYDSVSVRPTPDASPGQNARIRCPLPLINSNSDSLRQFYKTGVSQMRLLPPPALTPTSGAGTTINNVTTTTVASSTSSSSNAIALQTGLTTAALNPNQQFSNVLAISRSFQLIGVSANVACRMRLYGTVAAQSNDSGRALDYPPAPGTIQNLISDVVLDTPAYQWAYQNRIGTNGDSPQKQLIYVTVTNLSAGSAAITVSLTYVSLEA